MLRLQIGGGLWSKIGNFFNGRGEKSGTSEELQRGDVVNMFSALEVDLSREGQSSNSDISVQDNNSLASRMLNHPGFDLLFGGAVDSIVLGEGREIRSAKYEQHKEHESIGLNEIKKAIDVEKEKLGDRGKTLL